MVKSLRRRVISRLLVFGLVVALLMGFLGTYALDPASISPVGEQLEELRGYHATFGEFVLAVRELRIHEQLLALLDEKHTGLLNSDSRSLPSTMLR